MNPQAQTLELFSDLLSAPWPHPCLEGQGDLGLRAAGNVVKQTLNPIMAGNITLGIRASLRGGARRGWVRCFGKSKHVAKVNNKPAAQHYQGYCRVGERSRTWSPKKKSQTSRLCKKR